MSLLVEDIKNIFVCIENLLIISNRLFDNYLKKIEIVLQWLAKENLKVKPNECKWAMTKVEYLDHWITCKGVKPMTNKVEVILNI